MTPPAPDRGSPAAAKKAVPTGKRRPDAAPARPPVSRREWEAAVYSSVIPMPAKTVVLLVGTYMTWRDDRPGLHARASYDRLLEDLGDQIKERALAKYVAAAVRHGLLVVVSAPSPGRAAVYRAGIPTGEAIASPDATLPLDIHTVDKAVTPAHPCRCDTPDTCTSTSSHLHEEVVTPAPSCTPPRNHHYGTTGQPPSPPSSSTALPLLGVVDGDGATSPPSGDLALAPGQREVALVTAGLIASMPQALGPVSARWEHRAADLVAQLLARGWRTDQLLERVVRPSWKGAANPGAVLQSRLGALGEPPALAPPRPGCGQCDEHRQREYDGQTFDCPTCSPAALVGSPF